MMQRHLPFRTLFAFTLDHSFFPVIPLEANVHMAQKLLRRQDEAGRVAAYEVLVADAGVRSLIAENRIQQLDTSAGAEKERGRVQMDDAIYNLYMKSCITSGTAIAGAKDPEDMRRKVRLF